MKSKGAKVVVLLSHNGMDVDLKMASRVTGLDAIMGGHTACVDLLRRVGAIDGSQKLSLPVPEHKQD